MSKMSEMDMMVQDAVEMVESTGDYLSEVMVVIKNRWALDSEETMMVWREANARVYG